MKIVALHTDFRIYWPARLHHLSSKLYELGHELVILEIAGKGSLYSFAESEADNHISWKCLFPDEKIEELDISIAKQKVKDTLDEINPDIVVTGAFAFTSGSAALDWAKSKDKALVLFDDSKRTDVERNFFVNMIKKAMYCYVDAIFCPSEDWSDTHISWGFKPEAIFYGLDVVDNDFWAQKCNQTRDLPQHYFLCVGRQVERKNFHTVIKSFSNFLQNNPDFPYELIMVGDGPERWRLEALVKPAHKDKIHFLPFLDEYQLRELYQGAAFFIMPSMSEQWGLVVNEAMASGCPIIISRQCGCANTLVQDNINGFYFDTHNKKELDGIFKKIKEMPADEISKMGAASKDIISNWGLEKFSQGAIDAINYAIAHKRKPAFWIGRFLLKIWKGRYNAQ